MKKFTLFAAMAVVALSAAAQYEVDPGAQQVLDKKGPFLVHALFVDGATMEKFEKAGWTINKAGMVNNVSTNWWWWDGWTGGDGSYPGVDMHLDGYVAQEVTGTAGWSGGGLNVGEGANWDVSAFNENTRFHMAFRAANAPEAIAVIFLDEDGKNTPCKLTIGKSAFEDNGAKYPVVSDFDRAGMDWKGIDISFADLKKLWPAFEWSTSKDYRGNSFTILSGNVAGSNFCLDAVYFYTPLEAGVEGIEMDQNAPVVYYNLMGQRVENPTAGLYITRQGTKTSKVLVK